MKKILFLGAASHQLAPIIYAKNKSYFVITCDNKPSNPGHKLADTSIIISTVDKELVLKASIENHIDGIVSYASDISAPTAAYVAEKLNLPGNPFKSVLTLQRKDYFRKFQKSYKLKFPNYKVFNHNEKQDAFDWLKKQDLPFFLKPIDSSGSKGVNLIKKFEEFDQAFDNAIKFSIEKKIIIEEKINKSGHQIAGDGFVQKGKLSFYCFANENFDNTCNGLVPIGQSFPTTHKKEQIKIAVELIQEIINNLSFKNGALNFDFVFNEFNECFILEIGPRNGGCGIPEAIKLASGVDLIAATVETSIGNKYPKLKNKEAVGFWSTYVIHSNKSGILKTIFFSDELSKKIVKKDIYVNVGENIDIFNGSNNSLGELIIKFDSNSEMQEFFKKMHDHIQIELN